MVTPGRELVRRRDVDEPHPDRQRLDDQPLVVDGHRVHDGAVGLEETMCRLVAGILNCHKVAGVEDDPRDEVERLLRPGGDHHVVTRGDDGTRETGIPRDLRLKACVPALLVRAPTEPTGSQLCGHETAPRGVREEVGVGHAEREVVCRPAGQARGLGVALPHGSRAHDAPAGTAARGELSRWRATRHHEGAGATPGEEELLCDEPVVGSRDRAPSDTQRGSEVAGGRHAISCDEPAVEDRLAQLAVDRSGAIARAGDLDVQVHTAIGPCGMGQMWPF